MVSFKLTALLTAATFFLGASAHAIPGSNLSPSSGSLIPRALGDNVSPTPGTPSRFRPLKEKFHQATGGRLRSNRGSQVANDPVFEGDMDPAGVNGGNTELPPSRTSRFKKHINATKEKFHQVTGNKLRRPKGNQGSQVANDAGFEGDMDPTGVNGGNTELPPSGTHPSRLRKHGKAAKEMFHAATKGRFRSKSQGNTHSGMANDLGSEGDENPMDDNMEGVDGEQSGEM
ncbi:hypothetical protein RSOL_312090, partial [Rhizoctonia solani AG-3 Rhs1AP]